MKFSVQKANDVLIAVAEGATLRQVAKRKGMPTTGDVYKWTRQQPEFAKSLKEAEEWSARMFEEEALDTGRDVLVAKDKDTTSAARVLNEQLRWSAERRDVAKYGNSVKSTTVVPVQIMTTLNLGQPGLPPKEETRSVYDLEAKPIIEVPFEEVPALPPPVSSRLKYTDRPVGRTVKVRKRILTPRTPFSKAATDGRNPPAGVHIPLTGDQTPASNPPETTNASEQAVQRREQGPVQAPQGLKRRSESAGERGSGGESGQEPV